MTEAGITKMETYVSFKLGDEVFAANVKQLLTVIEVPGVTKLPMTPDYILGIINLWGKALPVIDMKSRFGMDKTKLTKNTCILVFETFDETQKNIGCMVDSTLEVFEIDDSLLQPPSDVGLRFSTEFLEGMYQKDVNQFISILNVNAIWS